MIEASGVPVAVGVLLVDVVLDETVTSSTSVVVAFGDAGVAVAFPRVSCVSTADTAPVSVAMHTHESTKKRIIVMLPRQRQRKVDCNRHERQRLDSEPRRARTEHAAKHELQHSQ